MKPDPIRVFLPPVTSGRSLIIGARQKSAPSPASVASLKNDTDGQSLWTTFWQEFCPENETHERCYVPGDGRNLVDRHWEEFADNLPSNAQVIDLGCGAGVVGQTLLTHRNDVHVAGVDWANVPAIRMARLTIHPWVRMEALPFGNGGFDAAVSMFGIEYGNIETTARELERVLKAGARFSFLVHHRESEIAREGSARRTALKQLTSGRMKAAFLAGNKAAVGQAQQNLKQQFPAEPMVDLVGTYFERHILQTRAERQAIWQKLADDLGPEIALLLHLQRAAKSITEMATWLSALLSTMRDTSVSVLRRNSGEPIAWHVHGIR